jgi:hypothetical protein
MRQSKRLAAARGVIYSLAVSLIPSASAKVFAFAPGQAMALTSQEPQQHPQPKPDQPNPNPQQQSPDTPQEGNKAVVVTGTIVKSGSDFVLKDSSGMVYRLDTPEKAEPFDGKPVKVTGKLEAGTNLLHVESIEAMTA